MGDSTGCVAYGTEPMEVDTPNDQEEFMVVDPPKH